MSREPTAIPAAVAQAMRDGLPSLAARTVAEIIVEVPSYADAFSGRMGEKIGNAVELALRGFLGLATARTGADPSIPIRPALAAAYDLGRGEVRDGRSVDALLAAYRVGARVSWREMSATAVRAGLSAEQLARFAELVFAYIDQLSAASVAGHSDELATTGRVRERYRERLASVLLSGGSRRDKEAAAEQADWALPRTLTAVIVPECRLRTAVAALDARALRSTEEVPGSAASGEWVVLLVPDAEGRSRAALLRSLRQVAAVVGPARPWEEVDVSYARALRALHLRLTATDGGPLDTETRLADLVLRADEPALADLQAQALAPLAELGDSAREKLTETLRSWLLHQGRRDAVAAELFVHPQTVRYRMTQLRELYGERLEEPATVLALVLALGLQHREGTTS